MIKLSLLGETILEWKDVYKRQEREVGDDGCRRARHPVAGTCGEREVRQGDVYKRQHLSF